MMDSLRGSPACRGGRPLRKADKCVEWVQKYMGDCLCSDMDILSFGVGLVSVFCWGVAEVPQIITNFREASTEGISLLFLLTWVLGDILNLLGCYLEPSTLPTQLYMAVLYTITTLILLGQVIYYEHLLKWREVRAAGKLASPAMNLQEEQDKPTAQIDAKRIEPQATSQPIALYAASPPLSGHGQLYFTSARSLASSRTPTSGSYTAAAGCGRGSAGQVSKYSILRQNSGEEFEESRHIPISITTSRSAPAPFNTGSHPTILRAVASVGMCVGGLNLGRKLMIRRQWRASLETSSSPHVFSRRKLLQEQLDYLSSSTLFRPSQRCVGVWLGWGMAVIYMGGRLPQIWLNIKRGSMEGLNPLMFTFALLGNVTYIASILIRTAKWAAIKSNMPWLVDAGVCVCLDCFILSQFLYYYTRRSTEARADSGGDYKVLERNSSS